MGRDLEGWDCPHPFTVNLLHICIRGCELDTLQLLRRLEMRIDGFYAFRKASFSLNKFWLLNNEDKPNLKTLNVKNNNRQ